MASSFNGHAPSERVPDPNPPQSEPNTNGKPPPPPASPRHAILLSAEHADFISDVLSAMTAYLARLHAESDEWSREDIDAAWVNVNTAQIHLAAATHLEVISHQAKAAGTATEGGGK